MLTIRNVKRVMIAIAGGTVLLVGIALIVLPAPPFCVIPAGLAILAVEFAWAKRWLDKTREFIARTRARMPSAGGRAKPAPAAEATAARAEDRAAVPARSESPEG